MKTGFWHGNDAVILSGNRQDGYLILVGGGYDKALVGRLRRLVREDKPLGDYDGNVVFASPEEWEEQQ